MLPLATKPVLPVRKRKMSILFDTHFILSYCTVLYWSRVMFARSHGRFISFSLFRPTCISPGLQKSHVRIYDATFLYLSVVKLVMGITFVSSSKARVR